MNKSISLSIGKYSLTIQLRDNTQSRKEDFIIEIDETKKQETIDSLDMDSLKQKAAMMRAKRQAMAQG